MTAPVTSATTGNTTSTNAADAVAAVAGGPLGKDQFMKLLVAQMTHQDPLSPMDGTQMVAQLAQFSSVEQLLNISSKMDGQTSTSEALLTAINNSTAVSLLGKTVTAVSDHILVGKGATTTASAAVPAGGGQLIVRITDANGVTLKTKNLGTVSGGQTDVALGDLTGGLADGTYRVAFDLKDANGAVTHPQSLVSAKIDGVKYGPNGAIVTSGALSFPISSIYSVVSAN